jgi:hypothetical protein
MGFELSGLFCGEPKPPWFSYQLAGVDEVDTFTQIADRSKRSPATCG